jgi:hypothetical protein
MVVADKVPATDKVVPETDKNDTLCTVEAPAVFTRKSGWLLNVPPLIPEVPAKDIPEVPDTPEVPLVPFRPEVLLAPEVPKVPFAPEVPFEPLRPEVREAPEVPCVVAAFVPEVPLVPPPIPEVLLATRSTVCTCLCLKF